ncbi:lmo0937 family membrane protein [Thiohalobacter thiocyanaticus]|uniref:Lmo0937 family membrane protein n=1 Tax=Thiohalobacter thiocyanaticus TaxID=585455 RepID=A0A426QFN8_9GAMM|nr:lmo0937 family membrane protein [Thiohalobacter thiocyanaticus]RRQ20562.1 lmo0937 family membrane protein [Thiohalobacter thiocyanaticus]
MLVTIAIVLLALWVLAFFTANTMGGLIHILLLFAVLVLLFRVFRGDRV